jgi:hypothetical protein
VVNNPGKQLTCPRALLVRNDFNVKLYYHFLKVEKAEKEFALIEEFLRR